MIIESLNNYFQELIGVSGADLLIILLLVALLIITIIRG